MNIEYCHYCGLPTGKAGPAEDSIYISWIDGEIGPLCEKCYDALLQSLLDDIGKVLVDDNKLYWLMLHVGCLLKFLPDNPATDKVKARCTLKDYEAGCTADAMERCWKAYLQRREGE